MEGSSRTSLAPEGLKFRRFTKVAIKGSAPDLPGTHFSNQRHTSNCMRTLVSSVTPSEKYRGHGILTVYPSPAAFAIGLGPTNPWLIDIAKETLVFRRAGISPALRLLVPTFSLRTAPLALTGRASSQARMLSYRS